MTGGHDYARPHGGTFIARLEKSKDRSGDEEVAMEIRRGGWVVVAVTCAGLLAGACTRTDEGVRIHTEEAGERAEEAIDNAGDTLERGAAEVERVAGPMIDDASITAKVKAKLAADPEVQALQIDVDTVANVVTLNGTVEVAAHSAEAEKLARGTEGVRQVVNRLTVTGGGAPGSAAAPLTAATPLR
jgi:hyperosmotically inducible protein